MWMHIDSEDYSYARAGRGGQRLPHRFVRVPRAASRPNGHMSRDMTLFKDDDGRAYLFFSSENNATCTSPS